MTCATLSRTLFTATLWLVCSVVPGGCRKDSTPGGAPPPSDSVTASPLAEFVVRDGNADLVFQYFAEASLRTAQTVADIPEAARTNVVVLSKAFQKGDLPADQVIVANLTTPQDDGTYPYRLVSRYEGGLPSDSRATTAALSGGSSKDGPGTKPAGAGDEVLLFTTEWCPHCRTARKWLTSNGISFSQFDVEKDANARAMLQKLGKDQGIPEHMLTSVPILSVKGKLILGFNEAEVRRLLSQ